MDGVSKHQESLLKVQQNEYLYSEPAEIFSLRTEDWKNLTPIGHIREEKATDQLHDVLFICLFIL